MAEEQQIPVEQQVPNDQQLQIEQQAPEEQQVASKQKFKFGHHKAHGISSNDVVQIFGLNNKGIDMPNTDKSTKFGDDDHLIKKYFADVNVVKKKHLAEAYEKALLDKTPEGIQDIASLTCEHLVQSLLFTNFGTYIT
ncbi:hypothetical protein C1H46_005495 [Malus baccata]|uniref:Uncharacterized protein n=1 Tax=Malus baccata TaxID=106549 RepID=A0A540NCW5_MALBA|nr:hypothetical protein C1H46_005495 [Malus baccata]